MAHRLIRPKEEHGTEREGEGQRSVSQSSKRKPVSSACVQCRKRKSKCDGAFPSCSSCTAVYKTQCTYDADSDHRRKGALKRNMQSLQQRNDALDIIVTSLRQSTEDESIALLQNLRSGTDLNTLAAALQTSLYQSQSFDRQLFDSSLVQEPSQVPTSSIYLSLPREESSGSSPQYSGSITPVEPPNNWLKTPYDPEFIQHLLDLFFLWIHPFHTLLSREYFLNDMNYTRDEFCSSTLVNAILSFACHYSDRQSARANPQDPTTAGDNFFATAKSELDMSNKSSLTIVQALAIMALREFSQGRDSSAYQLAGRCVRMAVGMGLHIAAANGQLPAPGAEVRHSTIWGVFNLETFFASSFGRFSQLPRTAIDVVELAPSNQLDAGGWQTLHYQHAAETTFETNDAALPSSILTSQITRLFEISSDVINELYASKEHATIERVARAYQRYSDWFSNLPSSLHSELDKTTVTPQVLGLHMYYYCCVLNLFRPYIHLDLRAASLYPRESCTFCANKISELVDVFRNSYGLLRVPLLVVSSLLSASTIHLLHLTSEESRVRLIQAFRDFRAMSSTHQFAMRCIEIVKTLANEWNILLPEETVEYSPRILNTYLQTPSILDQDPYRGEPTAYLEPFGERSPSQSLYYGPNTGENEALSNAGRIQSTFWQPFPLDTTQIASLGVVPSTKDDHSRTNTSRWHRE